MADVEINLPGSGGSGGAGFYPAEVTQARQKANEAAARAGDFASRAVNIQDELMRSVNEALGYNKDLTEIRSTALSDYLASPQLAEAKYGVEFDETTGERNESFIFNPFTRDKLIAKYIQAEEIPFMTANTLLGFVQGQAGSLVEAQTRAFQAQALAEAAAAERAQQTYSNVLNEFTTGYQLQQRDREIALAEAKARAASGGGGLSGAKYAEALGGGMGAIKTYLDDLYAKRQDQPGGGYISDADIENAFAFYGKPLADMGVSQEDLDYYKNQFMSGTNVPGGDVLPSFSGGSGTTVPIYGDDDSITGYEYQPAGYKKPGFLGGISNFLGLNKTVAPPSVDLSGLDLKLDSNINRGVSNTQNFMSDFDLGQDQKVWTGSASMR